MNPLDIAAGNLSVLLINSFLGLFFNLALVTTNDSNQKIVTCWNAYSQEFSDRTIFRGVWCQPLSCVESGDQICKLRRIDHDNMQATLDDSLMAPALSCRRGEDRCYICWFPKTDKVSCGELNIATGSMSNEFQWQFPAAFNSLPIAIINQSETRLIFKEGSHILIAQLIPEMTLQPQLIAEDALTDWTTLALPMSAAQNDDATAVAYVARSSNTDAWQVKVNVVENEKKSAFTIFESMTPLSSSYSHAHLTKSRDGFHVIYHQAQGREGGIYLQELTHKEGVWHLSKASLLTNERLSEYEVSSDGEDTVALSAFQESKQSFIIYLYRKDSCESVHKIVERASSNLAKVMFLTREGRKYLIFEYVTRPFQEDADYIAAESLAL